MIVQDNIASVACEFGFRTHNLEIPALAYRQFNAGFTLVLLDFHKTHVQLHSGNILKLVIRREMLQTIRRMSTVRDKTASNTNFKKQAWLQPVHYFGGNFRQQLILAICWMRHLRGGSSRRNGL